MKPLAVWFRSPRRGACKPDEDCLPVKEGHSVDPPDLPAYDAFLAQEYVRMKTRTRSKAIPGHSGDPRVA